MLDQKAVEVVKEKLEPVLKEQGFHFQEDKREEKGAAAVYVNEERLSYSVFYNESTKQFELRSATLPEDEHADIPWRTLSSWLFDPEQDDLRSAESIGNDFAETIQGPKRVEALQIAKKRHKKEQESAQDPLFFMNRLSNIIPSLKEDMIEERSRYGTLRPIAFLETYAMPKLSQMLCSGDDAAVQKFAELLNELYENGDMDVRSIITMVVLNGLDPDVVRDKLVPFFTEDMQKGYKAGFRMKGKNVKPEKVKKQSKVVAKALKNNQGRG